NFFVAKYLGSRSAINFADYIDEKKPYLNREKLTLNTLRYEWEEERVGSSSLLKLIYHGRFLHGSVTLSALSLPAGKTTVMHLVTRENLPEPNSSVYNVIGSMSFPPFSIPIRPAEDVRFAAEISIVEKVTPYMA
ncbi:unnamed protein product, partial [Toxocara canis]|uniref:Rad60-SLD_2 domain-containing protein n=1 Tax=Toxocara canis TaxID=6265 RepID=A0A183UJI4_TOXCA